MRLKHRLPLHALCSRKAFGGASPHPIFTGTHIVACNGVAAAWVPVSDAALDEMGPIPKCLMRATNDQDGDTTVFGCHADGVWTEVHDGAKVVFQANAAKLAMPDITVPDEPPAPGPSNRTVRVAINAGQLYRLARVLGAGGKDEAVVLEIDTTSPTMETSLRVTRLGVEGPVGSLSPFIQPEEDDK